MRREPTNIGPRHSCCAGYLLNSSTNSQLEPWAPWNLLTVPWPLIRRITARHALPLDSLLMSSSENEGPIMLSGTNKRLLEPRTTTFFKSSAQATLHRIQIELARARHNMQAVNSLGWVVPLCKQDTGCPLHIGKIVSREQEMRFDNLFWISGICVLSFPHWCSRGAQLGSLVFSWWNSCYYVLQIIAIKGLDRKCLNLQRKVCRISAPCLASRILADTFAPAAGCICICASIWLDD